MHTGTGGARVARAYPGSRRLPRLRHHAPPQQRPSAAPPTAPPGGPVVVVGCYVWVRGCVGAGRTCGCCTVPASGAAYAAHPPRVDVSKRQAVDPDAKGAPLLGQALGKPHHARLSGGVVQLPHTAVHACGTGLERRLCAQPRGVASRAALQAGTASRQACRAARLARPACSPRRRRRTRHGRHVQDAARARSPARRHLPLGRLPHMRRRGLQGRRGGQTGRTLACQPAGQPGWAATSRRRT